VGEGEKVMEQKDDEAEEGERERMEEQELVEGCPERQRNETQLPAALGNVWYYCSFCLFGCLGIWAWKRWKRK